MAYQPKDGQGALFKNDKDGNESRPDYKGNIQIEGVEYELAAWIKDGKKGKFLSINAQVRQRKDVSSSIPDKQTRSQAVDDDFNDDIPF